ncbi:hypothetical protein SBRCBS47491_006767 [Sporothrix bragantina]|uniref:Secreted protein n=1 Tax=Sporothrix bragantina TaxID=671064 RepID=A0ABP0C7Q2_9PEZI
MPPAATAAAAAALAANNDDRPSATTASSRTFGVHNILNPSEAQQTMAHSPSMDEAQQCKQPSHRIRL